MLNIKKDSGDIKEREILNRWQRSLSILLLSIVFIVFILETAFLVYSMAYHPENLLIGTNQYIVKYILYPTICNLTVFALWQFSLLRNHSRETQAWITMVGFILILSNILRTHYLFSVTYSILMVPLLLSVFYGSRRITDTVCAMAMCVYITTMMSIYHEAQETLNALFIPNALIGFVMIPLAALLVNSIIDREQEQMELAATEPERLDGMNTSLLDGETDLLNGEGILGCLKSSSVKKERIAFIVLCIDSYDESMKEDEASLTHILKNHISSLDVLARYDSGSFAWILRNPDEDDMKLKLESVKLEFDRTMMKCSHNTTISIVYQILDEDHKAGHVLSLTAQMLCKAALRGGDLILSSRE